MVSILAEFISTPMVRKAKSCWEDFHLIRLFLIGDVWGDKKCLFGVHRDRYFLSLDGATTATVIIAATWRINGCHSEIILAWQESFKSRRRVSSLAEALVSICFRLQSNPMVREKLVQPFSSIAQKLISTTMD